MGMRIGEIDANFGPLPTNTVYMELTATGFRPLSHVEEPVVPLQWLCRIEPLSIVLNHQGDTRVLLKKGDLDVLGLGMLPDIPYGLLGNPKEGEACFAGKVRVHVVS